jgi:energy-converting hydrogenase Eha subunit A
VVLPDTNDVLKRFNRETDWLAALVVGALVSAALILAVLVQDYHPNALDPIEEAVQAGGDLLLNANSAMVFKDVGLKGKKYTGEITSGQASSADHPLTEISPKENPSSSMEAAVSVPTPVLAITSELNHINAQTNRSALSSVIWQDSAPVIRPKIHIVRNRSSVAFRYGGVKRRLIELWHQSLAKSEKSRSWTAFSNLNRGERKKAAYTVETNH